MRIGAVTYTSEFKAMEDQAHFCRGAWTDFDALSCAGWEQIQDRVDAGLATREGCLRGKGVDEAHDLVASVAEVYGREFFAALIEREELKVGGSVVKPCHALGRGLLGAFRNNDFEGAEVAAGVAFLTAVVEPENAQGKDAVD